MNLQLLESLLHLAIVSLFHMSIKES